MNVKRITLVALVMAMSILFVECKKEKTKETRNATINTSVSMLKFATSEELFNYLKNVETNNEKSGFVSYGKKADDAYYSINPEEMFSNMDEVIDYVIQHRNLFQLILGSDGEYTVETKMYNHPFRNVANQDGIFQVGDTLYRILEGGYVYTSLDNEENLKQYVDKGCRQNTMNLKFYTFGEEMQNIKDRSYDYCSESDLYNEKTTGNNRITLQISNVIAGPLNNLYAQGYNYFAKPYHKSIGWWGCNRTITANVYKVKIGLPEGIFDTTEDLPTVYNLVHGGSSFSFSLFSAYHYGVNGDPISSCRCTATTPDAGTVVVECN